MMFLLNNFINNINLIIMRNILMSQKITLIKPILFKKIYTDSRLADLIIRQSRLTFHSIGIPSVIGFYRTELIYYGLIGQGYEYNERAASFQQSG